MKRSVAHVAVLLLAGSSSLAASPYAGEQRRDIKALSVQEVEAYVGGQGMGFEIVDQERTLDHLFLSQTVTPTLLRDSLDRIAALQARLRATHLQAHLEQAAILTPEQNALYSRLRGYGELPTHHQ